jgi:hypothetical protein
MSAFPGHLADEVLRRDRRGRGVDAANIHTALISSESIMRYLRSVLGVAFATLCGCTMGGAPSTEETVLSGAWGGVHVGLTLTPEGGTIYYDCAHGSLDAPARRDRAGRFEVAGVHVSEQGGPVRVGEVPDSVPARYLGQVNGDRMVLHVLAGPDTLGPFVLQRGVAPQLFRCL